MQKPRILFLRAAEGYEAMQLYAMYPGREVVLVDYDEFCKTDRFGQFPFYILRHGFIKAHNGIVAQPLRRILAAVHIVPVKGIDGFGPL